MITSYEINQGGKLFDSVQTELFDSFFLHHGKGGVSAYQELTSLVTNKLTKVFKDSHVPFVGKKPEDIMLEIKGLALSTREGDSMESLLDEIEGPILRNAINVTHEKTMAHLQCPPLLPALAAEMIISAFNQSMDSWDQSTAATYLEEEMIVWLTKKFGFPETSDGTFSSGGTQSNYMGLLLARDSFCNTYWGHNVQKQGLPDGFNRMRILCSEEAHFTVVKAASQLGLGEDAVVPVQTDKNHRLCLTTLNEKIVQLEKENLLPFALIGTCGTTDFESIDPLHEMAEIAKGYGLWFHVDAAFGGGLILSYSHSGKLAGIEQADSITVDFHKLFYQPISCGAFLIKNRKSFSYIHHHADYLNPEEDEDKGVVNLVNKSVQTTRRFDALKLFLSLRMIGTERFGEMIDYTFSLAQYTAAYMDDLETIKVLNKEPELDTVIFRFEPHSRLEF